MPCILQDLKADIRAVLETTLFTNEVNRRSSLQYITSEYHQIGSNYIVRLNEVPDKLAGITIASFTEVSSLPSLTGEFYVDYTTGYITFHSSDVGKVVNPVYFGKGSIPDATDINKIYSVLTEADEVTSALKAYALTTSTTAILIKPGNFNLEDTKVTFNGNDRVRMGSGGEYVLGAITTNYYNKILFTIASGGLLKKYEGTPASTAAGVVLPSIPDGEMTVCLVTVHDNGSGTAGSIDSITDADIEDKRVFLYLSTSLKNKFLTVPGYGSPLVGNIIDGFQWDSNVSILEITLFAATAPTGSSVIVDFLKNGAVQSKTTTLTIGSTVVNQSIAGLSYTISNTFGLKVTAVDSGETCEGLIVLVHYKNI